MNKLNLAIWIKHKIQFERIQDYYDNKYVQFVVWYLKGFMCRYRKYSGNESSIKKKDFFFCTSNRLFYLTTSFYNMREYELQ